MTYAEASPSGAAATPVATSGRKGSRVGSSRTALSGKAVGPWVRPPDCAPSEIKALLLESTHLEPSGRGRIPVNRGLAALRVSGGTTARVGLGLPAARRLRGRKSPGRPSPPRTQVRTLSGQGRRPQDEDPALGHRGRVRPVVRVRQPTTFPRNGTCLPWGGILPQTPIEIRCGLRKGD